jgi:hypothetical protein
MKKKLEARDNMKKVTIYSKEIISLCAVRNMINNMLKCDGSGIFDFLCEHLTPDDVTNFEKFMQRVLRDDKL